ncbi:TPA: hypothetical protein ACHF2V_002406 [Citrobacter farmeri]|uniref:Uncharacterized protein n=1 Tax=Citrobacter farmeri TaxID=67824 RepID=A0ACA8DBG1_9ENTR|nr:hypothetical protein [Citrobacter farmeri]AST81388.1 hypothetical protein CI104_20985 [Citrobacter farmeri]MCP1691931.1 hypothetical protein [Citrobacter farmeri]MCW2421801.1 hypothetical protein [Citrobacter farmeri]MEC3930995.1 hypothetical protein [Citrobacter farmeri]GAL50023.1 hypothetical protein YqfG [Citrobacter farmeri GTC 1319]
MNLFLRGLIALLLLMLMSIPAISDGIALGIESRFQFMLLFF